MRYRSRPLVLGALATCFLLTLGGTALAAETSSSDIVIIPEGDTITDDLYAAGLRILVEGVIEGDLVAFAAEEVVISGEVTGNVIAIAPKVTVSGRIGESLRVSGRELEVTGRVGEDVVAAVISAEFGPDSEVTGDVVAWAFNLTAGGQIGGDLEGTQRRLALEGEVGGDVNVSAGQLTISGPLSVGGDLDYRSTEEASGLDQATVGGAVVHKTPVPPNIRIRALALLTRLLVVIGLTAVALLLAWGWPERTVRAGEAAAARPFRAYGAGPAHHGHALAPRWCRRAGSRSGSGVGEPSLACDLCAIDRGDRRDHSRPVPGGRGSCRPGRRSVSSRRSRDVRRDRPWLIAGRGGLDDPLGGLDRSAGHSPLGARRLDPLVQDNGKWKRRKPTNVSLDLP